LVKQPIKENSLVLIPLRRDYFLKKFIMKQLTFSLLALTLLASCSSSIKRVYVLSKGPATVDEAAKTISAKDGTGHEEKVVNYTVTLTDKGLYVLNVKNDTIIGALQNYTAPKLQQNLLTQEDLKVKIDSLQQLVAGKIVSKEKNFFILPNQVVKITDNLEAIIVTPYHQMRSAEKVDGQAPEVYRFYSIREIRETIGKLEELTKPTTASEPAKK
jgi:hypothetical protein